MTWFIDIALINQLTGFDVDDKSSFLKPDDYAESVLLLIRSICPSSLRLRELVAVADETSSTRENTSSIDCFITE